MIPGQNNKGKKGAKVVMVPANTGIKTSEKLITTQLKALIARDLWDTNAYYVIINDINVFMTKAIQCLQDDTFKKMKVDDK